MELLTRKPKHTAPEHWQEKPDEQIARFSLSRCQSTPARFVALVPNPTSLCGESMNKPVSLDAALRERAREVVSGTISVEFEVDPAGNVRRRTKVTKLDIEGPDGRSETETVTEVLERRLISQRD